MKPQKDEKTGKWYIRYRCTDWQGSRRESMKRGFETKRAAEEWLRCFLSEQNADINMRFADFVDLYYKGITPRLREHTMRIKRYIIDLKITPFFGKRQINEITPADVIKWENELISQDYAPTYLKTVYNQLNAIFNYAVKYYNLRSNPCSKAGSIGKNKADEMNFWTRDEFTVFVAAVGDKPMSYTAYMTLFWTDIRVGELLALTPGDVDCAEKAITINKSYQRLGDRDVITPPKTPKSNRTISIPDFLCRTLENYINSLYGVKPNDRLFPVTKHFLHHEMLRGCEKSGAKRIRLHDIRHSHCALLYEMGIPALEIAERLGHERVETTLEIYTHLYPGKQQQLSDKLEAIYKEEDSKNDKKENS